MEPGVYTRPGEIQGNTVKWSLNVLVMVQYIVYHDYHDTPSCDKYIVTKAIL